MKSNRLYLDMHILQTVPPSCINRDDTGSPKTAIYGGVTRARVSSQSWKRSMRLMFKNLFDSDDLGFRTKKIVELVAKQIADLGYEGDSEKLATQLLINAGLKIKSVDKGTDSLFFISMAQAKSIAKLAMENPEVAGEKPSKEDKEKVKGALKELPGVDIALFGRMVADVPLLNTDACAQVAHSISTHKVTNEFDYFTAVDDISDKDNAGAGHIGTIEFNSSTLYRYSTVAVHELFKYLGEGSINAIRQFIYAFVYSMPTGKQNTFANRTLPDSLMISLRKDQPINYIGAFEKPVTVGDNGLMIASSQVLAKHILDSYKTFATKPQKTFVTGESLAELAKPQSFEDLLMSVEYELSESLRSLEV